MVATQAHGKIGHTLYRWSLTRWHEEFGDNVLLADGECYAGIREPAQWRARVFAKRALDRYPGADQIEITRGTYEESIIEDQEVGTIYDADWVRDERWVEHGWPQGSSEIEWEEESL